MRRTSCRRVKVDGAGGEDDAQDDQRSDRETCVIGYDDSPVGLSFHSTWAGDRDDETPDVAFCSEASDCDFSDILII